MIASIALSPVARPSTRSCIASQQARQTHQRAVVRCNAEQPSSSSAPEASAKVEKCPTCGVPKSEMSFGCDGSGRIMGGIGAVPGFGWWPIKAYRPCGKASAAGVRYQRKGQVLDDVLFGRSGEE